jgi:hypothetical protein
MPNKTIPQATATLIFITFLTPLYQILPTLGMRFSSSP